MAIKSKKWKNRIVFLVFFIGMCNSDDLFFRFHDIVTDERDELVQRSFSSAAFLVLDNKTVFVSAQDRFDTQKVACASSFPKNPFCQIFLLYFASLIQK